MDNVFWIIAASLLILIAMVAARTMYYEFSRKLAIDKLYVDFIALIEREYKLRLSGSNRFLVNQDILTLLYPAASADEIEQLFKRLVDAKVIDRDPIDQAWSLR